MLTGGTIIQNKYNTNTNTKSIYTTNDAVFFHDLGTNCIGYGDSSNNVFVYIRTDRGYGNRHKKCNGGQKLAKIVIAISK